MSRRMETRHQSRRAASKEALKQMQLMTAFDDDDSTEAYEITSDEDVVAVEMPPKKKYRLSHRKSSDGNDRDVLVLKTIRDGEQTLLLEAWPEDLSPAQKTRQEKMDLELKNMNARIDHIVQQTGAHVIYQGDYCKAIQIGEQPPSLTFTGVQNQPNVILQTTQKGNNQQGSYQLVMDPRIGLIVGTMSPATGTQLPPPASPQVKKTAPPPPPPQTRQTRKRGRNSTAPPVTPPQPAPPPPPPPKQTKQTAAKKQSAPASSSVVHVRPTESTAVGGLSTGGTKSSTQNVVDLTSDDGRPAADSREISFNKLQGKTFPSLVVVARPHLRVKETGNDRGRLDSKVKAVLMHAPTKFTEWLIQQGLVRSEQVCNVHPNSKLKLGMYSDVSKFPYSGGYVWISECCPQRFVSVFSGSLFEGSPHPPSVILKLIYHWACQTNVQNVVQWVKVDNLYVKGLYTWLRAACTVALHTHVAPLGGPGSKVEVGVISLGTTSQDGHQRQVKVEVLGLLETENKLLRLRAVEPLLDGDRNYKKRFTKILEPIVQWVHPDSIIITDLTVDKSTLQSMGFKNVLQSTSNEQGSSNHTIMEYLRRIVPRMFQNTLSLLSRQIIQQFLDELVWREWFGTTAVHAFDNMVVHLSQQTRCDTGQSLIMRLNKVASNPFKNWSISTNATGNALQASGTATVNNPPAETTPKRSAVVRRPKVTQPKAPSPAPEVTRPPKSISPDVPEQMVPLENYYYGSIAGVNNNSRVVLNLKCSMCRSHFVNNVKLMTHLFSHAHSVSAGSLQCRYCLASVTTSDGLHKHITTTHPHETRFNDAYACAICEQSFRTPYSLGKHMSREHKPGELPYACGTCGFRCSNHKQAVDHFYSEHDGGGTIQCPFCLKSTNVCINGRMLQQNLNFFLQHLHKHQKKALAKKCSQCALWFVQKETLKEHRIKMHDSQRHKVGLIPWAVPRHGTIMVPKSMGDHHPVEEVDINYASIKIDAPAACICKECKMPLVRIRHFPSLECCPNNNCQYATCCAAALKSHLVMCKELNSSLPVQPLPFEMYCVCGYSDKDGNTLARHLAICEKKSAYPSEAKANAAIVTHSMLDVLGLVRRPEERSVAPERNVKLSMTVNDESDKEKDKAKDKSAIEFEEIKDSTPSEQEKTEEVTNHNETEETVPKPTEDAEDSSKNAQNADEIMDVDKDVEEVDHTEGAAEANEENTDKSDEKLEDKKGDDKTEEGTPDISETAEKMDVDDGEENTIVADVANKEGEENITENKEDNLNENEENKEAVTENNEDNFTENIENKDDEEPATENNEGNVAETAEKDEEESVTENVENNSDEKEPAGESNEENFTETVDNKDEEEPTNREENFTENTETTAGEEPVGDSREEPVEKELTENVENVVAVVTDNKEDDSIEKQLEDMMGECKDVCDEGIVNNPELSAENINIENDLAASESS